MKYRPDIDGLRAVAVLAVVLFHYGLGAFSGGYVGVDVFFVISGYLIGGIVIDESISGRFAYASFYTRRIKRLLPAFLALGAITLPLGWWLLLPGDFRAAGKSLLAATVSLSNVLFYREAGYFDAAATTKPLLHTWSLGVEEQFYVFFPLLMRLIIRCAPGRALTVLSAALAASLAWSQYTLYRDPMAAFYLLPSRAWELLLGAVIAIPRVRTAVLRREALAYGDYLALASIVGSALWYTKGTPFPGLTAVPSCLGTAWLLWRGNSPQHSAVRSLLAHPASVWFGKISYSLYLWHWPVLVFALYFFAGELSLPARAACAALAILCASASWRIVETPLRFRPWTPRAAFEFAAIASAVVGTCGLLVWRLDGIPRRFHGEVGLIAAEADDFLQSGGQCWDEQNTRIPGIEYCRLGSARAPESFLIWGDSHVRAIRDGIDQLGNETGTAGLTIWKGGCPPVFGLLRRESASNPKDDAACAAQTERVRSLLVNRTAPGTILLVGRWAYYAQGAGIGADAHNTIRLSAAEGAARPVSQAELFTNALRSTVVWLHDHGYRVYVLEQFPEIPQFSGRRLFQSVRSGRFDVADAITRFGTVDRSAVEDRQSATQELLNELQDRRLAQIIRTHPLFCDDRRCTAWSKNGPTHFDNNPITVRTSREIRSLFGSALQMSAGGNGASVAAN